MPASTLDSPLSPSLVDVIILGAGVAGLACAARLVAQGLTVAVFEARDRVGGRACTVRTPDASWPVELGAEFVHGRPDALLRLARAGGLTLVRADGDEWQVEGERWRRLHDFASVIAPIMEALPDERTPDRSFAAVLADREFVRAGRLARELATAYVEGFNASDAREVSAHWLRRQEEGGGDAENFRLVEGYGRIVELLARQASGARVQLGAAATLVRWSDDGVAVTVSHGGVADTHHARRLVWTLPIGVWGAPEDAVGAVRIEPPLPDAKQESVRRTASGHAQRIVLRFREPFWRTGVARQRAGADLGGLAFLHTTNERYNVFWTSYPVESPLLTAWAGGPPAAAMSGLPHDARLGLALDALASATGEPRSHLEQWLERADSHDWSDDPFARGAYAYPRVGGALAARGLAAPVGRTLFFAGEATHTGTACGTVHGAIETGYRAADEVLTAEQG